MYTETKKHGVILRTEWLSMQHCSADLAQHKLLPAYRGGSSNSETGGCAGVKVRSCACEDAVTLQDVLTGGWNALM